MAIAPDRAAIKALEDALTAVLAAAGSNPPQVVVRRIREGLAAHADAVEAARSSTDPILMPRATFDPSDPKAIGRMVSIALLAQPLVALTDVRSAYGSGVYAIYYRGDHPLYRGISASETPIYVGKADPANDDASTTREQGAKLTARLLEHAGTIATAEAYAGKLPSNLSPLKLEDFVCRRLVCATNAQLVAEKHLIRTFWPVWNSETKACWGMSKHGDAATTRANKRSPWDVVHPGRLWALDSRLVDSLSPAEIAKRIEATLERVPPRLDHAALLEEMLTGFRQDDSLSANSKTPPVGGRLRDQNLMRLVVPTRAETDAARSAQMSRIRGRDTKPEMRVRHALHAAGFRYRLHARDLPGKPDIVFRSRRIALFVHGCFWHQHPDINCKLSRMPKSKLDFWRPKLEGNRLRDEKNRFELESRGWTVFEIWECETKPDQLQRLIAKLQRQFAARSEK